MTSPRRISGVLACAVLLLMTGSAAASPESPKEIALSNAPASRAAAASAPVLEQPADMQIHAGVTADQVIHATDADGDPLSFLLNAGPAYMSVSTTDPGTGFATGLIHLAPTVNDAGTATGIVAIYDGVNYRIASFNIAIFPVLNPVSNMTVSEGSTADQTLSGSTSNGYALEFTLVDAPPFASLTATSDSTANLHLAPGFTDSGYYTASVFLSDGLAGRTRIISILVNNTNRAPILNPPQDMHVNVWTVSRQVVTASDPDLDPIVFSKVDGPYFVDVFTTSTYPARGYVRSFFPANADTGVFSVGVRATDHISTSDAFFTMRVDSLNQPPQIEADVIDIAEGEDRDVIIVVTDTDAQTLSATVTNLPRFLTVGTSSQAIGSDTLRLPLRILPKYFEAGIYHPIVTATDSRKTTSDTLTIRVREAGNPETSLRLTRFFGPGARIDREYSTQDGDFALTLTDFTFLAVTGSGARWNFYAGAGWKEGEYDITPYNTLGFGIVGGDTTGSDLLACGFGTGHIHVQTVRRRLDGTMESLGATFDVECGTDLLHGELRYQLPGVPITLVAPHWLRGNTNQRMVVQPAAVDTAKDAVTIEASGMPAGATYGDTGNGLGTFVWTPSRLQSGDFHVRFIATSAGGLADTALTTFHITSNDLAPQARCGGPYFGTVGVPLPFTSRGTTDPDGDSLTYRWTFGDNSFSSEPFPRHTYARTGPFPISLVVSDGLLAAGDQTLATIQETDSTSAFTVNASTSNSPIQLQAGDGHYCIAIELPESPAKVVEVDPLSIRMEVKGWGTTDAIPYDGSPYTLGDANHNGVPDIQACFSSGALRPLFSKVSGTIHVLATISFSLEDGHGFRASLPVDVVGPDGRLRVLMAPNPIRSAATLSFVTTVPGAAKLTLFDSHGRVVRNVLDVPSLPTGYHDLPFDAHAESGRELSSGVYFYRLETQEGIRTGRIALIR